MNSRSSEAARQAATLALCQQHQNMMRHYFHRQVLSRLAAKRVLFLAAHPDDIVVGCGGVLAQLVSASVPVKLFYFTDGRACVAGGGQQAAMAKVRGGEANRLAQHLGIDPPVLVGCNELEFAKPLHRQPMVEQLRSTLHEFAPDLVAVPYLFDMHQDHRYANVLLAEAMAGQQSLPRVLGYEVWSFAPPGVVVDISEVIARKRELIRIYASQVEIFDYVSYADELGRSHAAWAGPGASFCEVFCPFSGEAFLETVGELALDSGPGQATEVLLTPPQTRGQPFAEH